jgi:hypothetical protein
MSKHLDLKNFYQRKYSIPVYPALQIQLFGAVQFPFEEQTLGFEEFFPEQMENWQSLPVYPELHEQLFGDEQFPNDEQTLESEEFFPKQMFH